MAKIGNEVKESKGVAKMRISERIFKIMEEKHMSQNELSRRTGIPVTTISDWNVKKTNPAAEKIMPICRALDVTPQELLEGDEPTVEAEPGKNRTVTFEEIQLVDDYREFPEAQQRRIQAYLKRLKRDTRRAEDGE